MAKRGCQRCKYSSDLLNSIFEGTVYFSLCVKQQTVALDFPKYPVLNDDTKLHPDNLIQIKTFLAELKPSESDLTMPGLLSAVKLDYDAYTVAIRSTLNTVTTFIQRTPSELRIHTTVTVSTYWYFKSVLSGIQQGSILRLLLLVVDIGDLASNALQIVACCLFILLYYYYYY